MKPIWVILITIVATAGIIGGGTYYYLNKKATTDKNNLQSQINDLNTKLTAAEKSLADTQAATTAVTSTFNKIAYLKNKSIWTADANGNNAKVAYTAANIDSIMAFSFSADKTWLAYTTLTGTKTNLYVIKNDLTGVRALNINNLALDAIAPSWSPDGTTIAFAGSANGKRDIYKININTGVLTNLTNTSDYEEMSPSWSPDGTKIVFESPRGGTSNSNWHLYTMNIDGSGQSELASSINDIVRNAKYVTNTIIATASTQKLYLINTDGTIKSTVSLPSGGWLNIDDFTIGNNIVYEAIDKGMGASEQQTLSVDLSGNTSVIAGLDGIAPVLSN